MTDPERTTAPHDGGAEGTAAGPRHDENGCGISMPIDAIGRNDPGGVTPCVHEPRHVDTWTTLETGPPVVLVGHACECRHCPLQHLIATVRFAAVDEHGNPVGDPLYAPTWTPRMLSVSQLRERGWTPALIRDLLGGPDEERRNPYYGSAAPMQLYALDRVAQVEGTGEYAERRQVAERRRAAARARTDAARRQLLADVDEIPITVSVIPLPQLYADAVRWATWDGTRAVDVDQDTLDAWAVYHVRRFLTPHDTALAELPGRVGREQAAARWRARILAAIANAYPTLADECTRQLDNRDGHPAAR